MKIHWKRLLLCLAIPLAVGGLSAWLTSGEMKHFEALNQPPLSPPSWLFPVVWTILFILMGIASYLVLEANAPREKQQSALLAYGAQLIVNFFWSLIFFNAKSYLFAFVWLLLLWALILLTISRFAGIRPAAGWLLVPYLAWVTFAGYLNFGVFLLN